ncbi:MAG: hypothetical protein IJI46_00995 [Erysipelotrichaceae bacterium]|nr:hypothetical protein [Erysipelotrichaceae bacterium]
MKSKVLKTYNLPEDNLVIAQIDAKPTYIFVILILVALVSFMLEIPNAYGIILLCLSIACLIYMPRVLLMEFYNEYLVMYNRADKNNCVLIYYEDITSWYYAWGANHDYLYIELADGSKERIEAFSRSIFESNMNRFLKDKKRKIEK